MSDSFFLQMYWKIFKFKHKADNALKQSNTNDYNYNWGVVHGLRMGKELVQKEMKGSLQQFLIYLVVFALGVFIGVLLF